MIMVYAGAAQKTLGYMALSLVMGVCIITLLSGDLEPTGRVVSDVSQSEIQASTFVVFLLGVMVGALAIGTYTYLAHYEKKREW